jgi:hypothetical protein
MKTAMHQPARALLAILLCACGGRSAGSPSESSPSTSTTAFVVSVQSVQPAFGPTAGGIPALVTGAGFVEGFATHGGSQVSVQTLVTFGGVAAADLNVIDDNRIELTVPAGAPGLADVAVTNPNGAGTCSGCFRYVAPIEVNSIVPPAGQAGVSVTIHGQGFAPESMFTIGGRELISPQVVDAQTATGLVPPGAAGVADVLAVTFEGIGQLRSGFAYTEDLRLDAATPGVTATAGGAKVILAGAGFAPGSVVLVDGAPATTVWVDDQHLQLVAPAHAAGAVDLSVSGVTLAQGLTFADAGGSALFAVQPPHGPAGTVLHLYGSGLSALQVTIGGQAAAVQSATDTELDVLVPPGTGTAAVQAGPFTASFTYDPILAVTSIEPACR